MGKKVLLVQLQWLRCLYFIPTDTIYFYITDNPSNPSLGSSCNQEAFTITKTSGTGYITFDSTVYLTFAHASSMGCSQKYVSLCQTDWQGNDYLGTMAWGASSNSNCIKWHVDDYNQKHHATKNATILPGEKKRVHNDHKLPDNA